MLTTEPHASSSVVGIVDQLLDRVEAAAFIRASLGIPIEPLDLERHAKAFLIYREGPNEFTCHDPTCPAQDYAEAAKWFQRAADQGDRDAQSNLGYLYQEGRGVAQDYVRAHMWFNLAAADAAAGKQNFAAENRDKLAAKMTPAQIAEAQRLAREWKLKYESTRKSKE